MIPTFRRVFRITFPLYVVVVAFLSLTPEGPGFEEGEDKWAHYAAYMVMALIGMPIPRSGRSRFAMAVFVLTLGAVLEAAQGLVPGRYPDIWDSVANVAGALMGMGIWWIGFRRPGGRGRNPVSEDPVE